MLDINLAAVMTQAIGFVLLVVLMGKFVYPRVGEVIENRQSEIQSTLDHIAADRRAMEETRARYEQQLANIEAEAREHIAGAMRQAQEEAAAILAKTRDEAAAHRDRALADIEQERKKAIVEIRSEMADLAVVAASKILEREINPNVHRDLIGHFIQEVGAQA